jgi:CheY-like chemotaxis protein
MIHIACIEGDKESQFTFEEIAAVLRARGFENQLRLYTSPAQALEQIPLERPEIVFVDVRLYDGRKQVGLDLTRALRNHPLCRRTALVGMAEYPTPADQTAALMAGCHEFMAKPVRYQAVEDAIIRLVIRGEGPGSPPPPPQTPPQPDRPATPPQ